ncbi:TonB-dependent siderophore receptor [Leptolyngbya sp. 7M]|uniref:TonB-dependent siderophore receptor n=1 Tax=Leptolyngbya sp. 7M TaxID=2812896 RepID=UPI001B8CC3CE|nr:TonB-dependent siderophore receptor [Leptolyngbya sp. 7M]QYO67885.1 TonB-dependent siderophore receptor [Leptolyngbya sp. 7M]
MAQDEIEPVDPHVGLGDAEGQFGDLNSRFSPAPVRSSEPVQLSEIDQPATTIEDWVAQIEASLVQITNVRVETTEAGLQVILETAGGSLEVPETRSVGNALIADIPNATIAEEFSQAEPIEGIALVSVTSLPGDRVRVAITGTDAPPVAEITSDTQELTFAVTLGNANTVTEEDAIQVVVTGEQDDDYYVPNTSVGTRTDTPLRDIPQSILVIPQQVLEDRQVRSITEGLENAAGVTSIANPAGSRDYFTIRGFENYGNFLVNGIPDPQIPNDSSFINVERLELLRGPASVLYGETGFSGIGGTINVVTRQPLDYPFYEVSATAGSYSDYQGAIDFSGPLNDSETVLYRLIAAYRNFDSFLDFDEGSAIAIAPSLALRLGPNTDFILEGDVNILERNGQLPQGQPAVGTVLPNPNGEIDRSFNSAGPQPNNLTIMGRVGYRLEHRFNDNWSLRNAFRYLFADDNENDGEPIIFNSSFADDNRTINRRFLIGSQYYNTYYLNTDLLGTFSTGAIQHRLLLGFSLDRDTSNLDNEIGDAAPVDAFNPVFDQTVDPTGNLTTDRFTTRDTLGVYVQDQITILENLKLLLGGRVDLFEETTDNRLTNEETNQSDTAFSPRVGIVYQPIPPISLYAGFAQSFAPTIGFAENGDAFQPERGTQYEVGIKADINEQLSANLAFYDLTRSNVTTPNPENPTFSVQTGKQRSQGIELDISGEILPGWNIIGGYAYTNARVTEDNAIPEGNRLFSAPEHSFNLWTTYRIQDGDLQGLGFGLGLYYVGERWADNANTAELPSFFRTDAAIFYERDRFRAALNFRNLFDVEYYTSNFGSSDFVNRGLPFTLQGTISWQF